MADTYYLYNERRLTGWRLFAVQVGVIVGAWLLFLAIGYGAYRLLGVIWPS